MSSFTEQKKEISSSAGYTVDSPKMTKLLKRKSLKELPKKVAGYDETIPN